MTVQTWHRRQWVVCTWRWVQGAGRCVYGVQGDADILEGTCMSSINTHTSQIATLFASYIGKEGCRHITTYVCSVHPTTNTHGPSDVCILPFEHCYGFSMVYSAERRLWDTRCRL